MGTGFYGDEMARYLRPERTEALLARTPRGLPFAATRLTREAPDHGPNLAPLPREEAFLFTLQLRELRNVRAWVGGKPIGARKLSAGALTLTDMRAPPDIHVSSAFDCLVFYLSRGTLDELASDADAGRFEGFDCALHEDLNDPVVHSLACSLLPSLARRHAAETLFVDHVCWALRYHLAYRYARFRAAPARGGLAPRQLQRAKELMRRASSRSRSWRRSAASRAATSYAPSARARVFHRIAGCCASGSSARRSSCARAPRRCAKSQRAAASPTPAT